jgi:putative nucleotidyltransferase with HDIG domain
VAVLALDGSAARRAQDGAAADEELRRLASVVAARLRAMDIGCRSGVDDLVVVLPEASGLEAYGVGERLRAAVAADPRLQGRALSVGIASHPDGAATPPQLLAHARTALLYALRHGGDRCFLYDHEVARLLRSEDDERRATQQTLVETVTALAATVDGRHPTTRGHSQSVARIAALIAQALGLAPERVEDVRLAGLVHDVGKMGIDEEVLLSPGPLTPAQWEEMRQHPELGQRMLAGSRLEPLRPWVLHHHERMDGSGYPYGLAGDEIPLEARILAAAEALDAMTSGGPHRLAITRADALAELRRCAGSQFDPRVVNALLSLDAAGRLGAVA